MAPATHILMESGWEGTLGQFQSSLKIAEQAAFRNQLPKFILFPEDLSRDRVVMDSSSVLLLIHCSTVSRAESLSPTLPALHLGFKKRSGNWFSLLRLELQSLAKARENGTWSVNGPVVNSPPAAQQTSITFVSVRKGIEGIFAILSRKQSCGVNMLVARVVLCCKLGHCSTCRTALVHSCLPLPLPPCLPHVCSGAIVPHTRLLLHKKTNPDVQLSIAAISSTNYTKASQKDLMGSSSLPPTRQMNLPCKRSNNAPILEKHRILPTKSSLTMSNCHVEMRKWYFQLLQLKASKHLSS